MTTPFFLMFFLCCECNCVVRSPSPLATLFVHPWPHVTNYEKYDTLTPCVMNYENQDSLVTFMSNFEMQRKSMAYASMLDFEMLHHRCLWFHALEHLKPCVANFEQIDEWSVHVARSICNVSILGMHFHHDCKWVLHLHYCLKNEVALWEGLLKDENSLKSI